MRFLTRFADALLFLAGPSRWLERRPPERFARLGWHLVLLGVVWGLALAGLWEATYLWTFPRLLNWIVPALACTAATVLGPYRRGCLSLTETMTRPLPPRWARPLRWAGLLAVAGLWWALLHALGWKGPDWPRQLPSHWAWLWPRAMYRVLLLSPVWGAWSMLVIGQFHRPNAHTDPPTRHFAASVAAITAAGSMVVPLAATFVYLLFLWPPLRFVPPAAAVLAALGGGTVAVRFRGGLDRGALLTTNVVTQLAFLAAAAAVT